MSLRRISCLVTALVAAATVPIEVFGTYGGIVTETGQKVDGIPGTFYSSVGNNLEAKADATVFVWESSPDSRFFVMTLKIFDYSTSDVLAENADAKKVDPSFTDALHVLADDDAQTYNGYHAAVWIESVRWSDSQDLHFHGTADMYFYHGM